jgi:6-pyruvoyltetrahydropterin/6-carboxytetrahydropterin synthase
MFEVAVEQTFAAGHALRNYKGRCENVHGHNFKVRVVVEGEKLDETGLLVDFLDVKAAMQAIIDRLDHVFLNDVAPFDVKNPSAENIAEYFFTEIARSLKSAVAVRVRDATVWETEIQSATYRL